ncbi:MAG TPA: thioesterase family protein, partial [Acidimicrobiales bacterium]|nr:thioesterase family protein [Acidimicrobiales bacterium]
MAARTSLEPSRDRSDYRFSHRLRTRFAETDAMGVIHHAAYLPYLEEARVEYLKAIGHPYDEVRAGDGAGGDRGEAGRDFPVLEASVQYRRPLRFDEEVEVALLIGAVTGTTFQVA